MKPDDISLEAWDQAATYTQQWASGPGTVRMTVARAIMAAVEAEREACATLSEEWEGPSKLLPMAGIEHNEGAAVGMHEAGERIAAAIRQRGANGSA